MPARSDLEEAEVSSHRFTGGRGMWARYGMGGSLERGSLQADVDTKGVQDSQIE